MSAAEVACAISDRDVDVFFADLLTQSRLVLAVSGGPDSTALLYLAARWRDRHPGAPDLIAVTVDHGLRVEAAAEAHSVAQLAQRLGVAHRTMMWRGAKPKTGVQEKARTARYALLAQAAHEAGAACVLVAHTQDDQAETVLFRLARGSGLTGIGAMPRVTALTAGVRLVRPLLDVPKSRLLATLQAADVAFCDDPSNRDPRFTRPRLRAMLPSLAREGLDARALSRLARRMRRADVAIEAAVDDATKRLSRGGSAGEMRDRADVMVFDMAGFRALPEEVGLRLLGRAIARTGREGVVELAKLEALVARMMSRAASCRPASAGPTRVRATLAGAMVTSQNGLLTVETAPPRGLQTTVGSKTLRTGDVVAVPARFT